jgi:hypothetical protein
MKSYYRLLRWPGRCSGPVATACFDDTVCLPETCESFTWRPRTEDVLVAGVPVEVDYLDERKFARTAAAKAKAGVETLDLTYRLNYVEDPAGQWQGYKDSSTSRAWGVDEWALRAGQGAYLDWVVSNALLPATAGLCRNISETICTLPAECEADEDCVIPGGETEGICEDLVDESCDTHRDCDDGEACRFPEGIRRIDRQTVSELGEIADKYGSIQALLDQADAGMNPLGLAKGVVPFDIDPNLVAAGMTHFEQVYDRALLSLRNLTRAFDHANLLSQSLRRNQDTVDDFTVNVAAQERQFKYRLIEIFGYPYSDDIGPLGTYRSGYDGPDLYHHMYVDDTELTGESAPLTEEIATYFTALADGSFDLPVEPDLPGEEEDPVDTTSIKEVKYTIALDGTGIVKPAGWAGARRAPGELQMALSDLYRSRADYRKALLEYGNLLERIEDEAEMLSARYGLNAERIRILENHRDAQSTMQWWIIRLKKLQEVLTSRKNDVKTLGEIWADALPKSVGLSNDATGPARAALRMAARAAAFLIRNLHNIAQYAENELDRAKQDAERQKDIDVLIETDDFEVLQAGKALEQLVRQEAVARLELFTAAEVVRQSMGRYLAKLAEGQRLLSELIVHRKQTAASMQNHRYRDMAFRVFHNDALQKYRAQFDMAARYAYLAATAYDYETNLLGSSDAAGRRFLTDIVQYRSPGRLIGGSRWGEPVAGSHGLADPLARMKLNFDVLRTQMGFNNPQNETNLFSLRNEFLRSATDQAWRDELAKYRVENLWDLPEFRRYARPFAAEPQPCSPGPCETEPGLVIGIEVNAGTPLATTVTAGLNYFGWPLGTDDSAYDPSQFATKIRAVGVWLENYDRADLSATPRAYLVPAGMDVLRSPDGDDFETREWRVIDQKIPVPFPIEDADLDDPGWIPLHDTLAEDLAGVRRYSALRAHALDPAEEPSEATSDTRLVGRSVWNTRWLLIIPGRLLDNDPTLGLDQFIEGPLADGDGVSDIKLLFQTYAYSGN